MLAAETQYNACDKTIAEALQMAQLATLACRPHAGYWAAFAVWGRGFDAVFV